MSNMSSAFPKLFHVGTGYIADLFDGEVEVTEKIDGSQFGFGKGPCPDCVDGMRGYTTCGTCHGEAWVVQIRSKGKIQNIDAPDKMFQKGADYVKTIADRLPEGYVFYGEYLNKPRHSTLAYDRIPANGIALFGVKQEDGLFIADFASVQAWAEKLGIEPVSLLFRGTVTSPEQLHTLLATVSALGGQKVEGFVVKRYEPWIFGGMVLPLKGGKYVSEAFKEVHGNDWAKENTAKGGFEKLKAQYRSETRWHKAVQHLTEGPGLSGSPQDIGPLIKEVRRDLAEECKEDIKSQLWQVFGDDILKNAIRGLPEYYKKSLMAKSFEDGGLGDED